MSQQKESNYHSFKPPILTQEMASPKESLEH